ncbi:MAG TPA: hypothetical protein VM389_12550, partial [Phycisphaerae bacterium]|nr:hypothetical protein [Phycisphaerae bacterium]
FWGTHGFHRHHYPTTPDDRWIEYRLRIMNMLHKAGIRFTQVAPAHGPGKQAPAVQARIDRINATLRRHREARKIHNVMFRPPGTFHPLWTKARYDDPWPGDLLAKSMEAVPRLAEATGCTRAELLAEDRISTRWLQQVPWWWLDKPRPAYTPKEKRNLAALVRVCSIWVDELRKKHPGVKVVLGNDYPLQIEALLNEGFARKGYLDVAGMEGAQFMRMPENPTFLTVTSFTRMMREALDRHGGRDVPIWSTEAFYPCTQPGNLSERTQARYVARTLLVGLAAGLEKIAKPFGVYDMSNDYRFSHWGQPGLCREDDELQPKPSYTAYAVVTRMLDRCRHARNVETGSSVVFAPAFRREDGHEVCALWTLRGARPAVVTITGKAATQVDLMGRGKRLDAGAKIELTLSPDPVFLAGPAVRTIALGPPRHDGKPEGPAQLVSSLEAAAPWRAGAEPPGRLETGNFENPRVKGRFELRWGWKDPDRGPCLRVAFPPLPPKAPDRLIARYAVLELEKPVVLKGHPRWIGAWVHGRGNWGRLIYHLTDAEGEEWISIGMPGEFNVNDPFNVSFLNHDGWRLVRHDLPGHFGGPSRYHWPTQCIWGHFKPGPADGKGKPTDLGNGVVDWPLTFRKLIVEMRDTILYLDGARRIADNSILVQRLQVGGEGWK